MINKEKGQTVVIGSLLLLALAVGVIVYVQISVFPDINKQNELDSQNSAVQSMVSFRSTLQTTLATGGSQSVLFDNSVVYAPQPAAPPDQYGQLSFVSGDMSLEDAEIKVNETRTNDGGLADVTEDLYINQVDRTETVQDVSTVVQFNPSYIELSDDSRWIKMDNTIVYEQNPDNNRVKHTSQSVISGRTINLIAPQTSSDGVKKQKQISISINPMYKIDGKIRGDNGGNDNMIIRTRTTESNEQDWDDLESNNNNVININNVGDELVIVLDGEPESGKYYDLNFVRAQIQFE